MQEKICNCVNGSSFISKLHSMPMNKIKWNNVFPISATR